MLKKYSIITILLFAYTIVLGHSIIPHHHHDHHEMEGSASHHDDDDHDDEEAGLAHDLANYKHSNNAGDIYQQPDVKVSFDTISNVYILALFNFNVKAFESPPPLLSLLNDYIPIVQHCLSSKGLRAPPCALV